MRIEEKISRSMILRKKTLATAESCTGGLIANRLTNVPGSSGFFHLGLITYSNEAKIRLLKIPKADIRKYGAVSKEIAIAMAQGVRRLLKTDFGISVTGIAGPTGGTKTKPVGLTFIAVSFGGKTICRQFLFKGSRKSIKTQAATQALRLLDQSFI